MALVALGNAAALSRERRGARGGALRPACHTARSSTATIVARELAEPGREGQAVSIMVLGQTVANMVGVPGGTLLAGLFVARRGVVRRRVGARPLLRRASCPPCAPSPTRAWRASSASSEAGPWLVIGAVATPHLLLVGYVRG
ncbi:MAG: hypothetical protein ACLT98_18090 [Eggerthellaceae bacterium]